MPPTALGSCGLGNYFEGFVWDVGTFNTSSKPKLHVATRGQPAKDCLQCRMGSGVRRKGELPSHEASLLQKRLYCRVQGLGLNTGLLSRAQAQRSCPCFPGSLGASGISPSSRRDCRNSKPPVMPDVWFGWQLASSGYKPGMISRTQIAETFNLCCLSQDSCAHATHRWFA